LGSYRHLLTQLLLLGLDILSHAVLAPQLVLQLLVLLPLPLGV